MHPFPPQTPSPTPDPICEPGKVQNLPSGICDPSGQLKPQGALDGGQRADVTAQIQQALQPQEVGGHATSFAIPAMLMR